MNAHISSQPFTIRNARYAKGMKLVQCAVGSDGYKTRTHRLCDALKGRWTNREHGYVMSPTKARRLQELYDAGWDATAITSELIPPSSAVPSDHVGYKDQQSGPAYDSQPVHGFCDVCKGRIDKGMQWTFTRQMNRVHADPDRCIQALNPEVVEEFLSANPGYEWPGY